MPEISRFFGIVIAMFFDDHNPPHFHARYGSYSITIKIEDFAILEGHLPPKALGLVIEWADIHKEELFKDWELAKDQKPLFPIEPVFKNGKKGIIDLKEYLYKGSFFNRFSEIEYFKQFYVKKEVWTLFWPD